MGYVEFLKFGPIGLAGLMLVLTMSALVRPIDERQERTLKRFLNIGAFCFVIACIFAFIPEFIKSGHWIYFRVEPMASGRSSGFPSPIITINSEDLSQPRRYFLTSDVTAIIDVTDSIRLADRIKADADVIRVGSERQASVLTRISERTPDLVGKLQRVNSLALDNGCPGGAHGLPIPHGGEMAAASSEVIRSLTDTQREIREIVQ
jgi:hypothetical protein